jgi:hypothetical protein
MAIKNATLYEDNYGFYNVEDSEEEAFYVHIVKQSITKKCGRCKRKVKLMEHMKICASCSDAIEFGGEKV